LIGYPSALYTSINFSRVIATVAAIVYSYTPKNTESWIIFSGNTEVKTRLYRMAITKNYEKLNVDFLIFGLLIVDGIKVPVPFNGNTPFWAFI